MIVQTACEVALRRGTYKERVRHTIGMPGDPQEEMPMPEVLVLEPMPNGSAMLFRFTAAGEDAGDTWHQTVAYAKEQAASEFEGALGMWVETSADPEQALQYALKLKRAVMSQ